MLMLHQEPPVQRLHPQRRFWKQFAAEINTSKNRFWGRLIRVIWLSQGPYHGCGPTKIAIQGLSGCDTAAEDKVRGGYHGP
jgi:hypothetical protein